MKAPNNIQDAYPNVKFSQHKNGGGWVSILATVPESVFVASTAIVFGEWASIGARARIGEWASIGEGAYAFCALVGRCVLSHSAKNTVSIGCETHSIKNWLGKVGRDIKAQHPEVSSAEWKTMKDLIRMLAKMKQPGVVKA
jgi:hypothetical protein